MNEAALDLLASEVRASVAAGQYTRAQAGLEAYGQALAGALEGLPPDDPAIGRLEEHSHQFLNVTRQHVLRDRAHASLRSSRLLSGSKTYQDQPFPRRTWQCMG